MQIKIWGCRGSLPTPGTATARYGGNTTCVETRLDNGSVIIFDAGSGMRKLGRRLVSEGITEIYLFLTHAHWDHLMGFPFFGPAYSARFTIHVRGGPRAKRSLRGYLQHQMETPYFPVRFNAMKAVFDFTHGEPDKRKIGSVEIIPMGLSHPGGCYGFKVLEGGKSFVFFTDHELDFRHEGGLDKAEYVDFCKDTDLLIHDAQYTDEEYRSTRGWGHSTFGSATAFGTNANVKRLGIFHHDPDHEDDFMDACIAYCQRRIKEAGAEVDCFAAKEGMEIVI